MKLFRTLTVALLAMTTAIVVADNKSRASYSLYGEDASQQELKFTDYGIFNHLAINVSAGLPGAGIEIAAPCTEYLQFRAGYSFMPEYSYKQDVDYTLLGNPETTEAEAKLKWNNGHFLVDVYPFKGYSFHVTGGAYVGSDKIVTVQNTTPLYDLLPGEGIEIGDYIVDPGVDGIARAAIKVNKFKPYAGIGFGRAVPRRRVGFSADLGVQFWGSPTLYNENTNTKLTSEDVDSEDGGFFNTLSDISVWPVINLRLTIKLF